MNKMAAKFSKGEKICSTLQRMPGTVFSCVKRKNGVRVYGIILETGQTTIAEEGAIDRWPAVGDRILIAVGDYEAHRRETLGYDAYKPLLGQLNEAVGWLCREYTLFALTGSSEGILMDDEGNRRTLPLKCLRVLHRPSKP